MLQVVISRSLAQTPLLLLNFPYPIALCGGEEQKVGTTLPSETVSDVVVCGVVEGGVGWSFRVMWCLGANKLYTNRCILAETVKRTIPCCDCVF